MIVLMKPLLACTEKSMTVDNSDKHQYLPVDGVNRAKLICMRCGSIKTEFIL